MCLSEFIPENHNVHAALLLLLLWLHHACSQVYSDYNDHKSTENEATDYKNWYENYDGDYGGYSWGSNYGGGYYEYSLEEYNTGPILLECYTCHFSKRKKHSHGMPNCDEPFKEDGIPTIQCDGQCGRTKMVIGDGEYMMIRSCLPNCHNIDDPLSSVECCGFSKCNGARAGSGRIIMDLTSFFVSGLFAWSMIDWTL